MVWYSRIVRVGSPVRWASSSIVSDGDCSASARSWVPLIGSTLPSTTVTVNTVTIVIDDVDDIETVLRTAWPHARLTGQPMTMSGGQWATMWRVSVSGTPADVPGDLVVRVVPDPTMGAKEMAVQQAVAEAGIRTPHVRLTGPAGGPLIGAWAVMDFAAGAPPLGGLDGAAAVRRAPQLITQLPRQLADTMADIHRVDPAPAADRVRTAAPTAAFTIDRLWSHQRAAAGQTEAPALDAAIDVLAMTEPDHRGAVLCHGDLHPFNILAAGDNLTIVDWTGAVVAPPAYDLAFTWLLLRYPPLQTPAALQPAIRAAVRLLARRFVHRYRTINPAADLDRLDWYAAMHAVRILTELTRWRHNGDRRADTHPWRLVAPGASSILAAATGVNVPIR